VLWRVGPDTAASAADLDGPPVDVHRVTAEIADILDGPAYRETEPSLLERLLGPLYTWLERVIAFVLDQVLRVVGWVVEFFQILGVRRAAPILVVVVAGIVAAALARRRARDIERRTTIERILEMGTDPAELERLALAAETGGEHGEAIRLRFVAGLLRLDTAGRIDFYPGLSNATISENLGDGDFDSLAAQFDRVVYGRRPAGPGDSTSARSGWARLLGVRV